MALRETLQRILSNYPAAKTSAAGRSHAGALHPRRFGSCRARCIRWTRHGISGRGQPGAGQLGRGAMDFGIWSGGWALQL